MDPIKSRYTPFQRLIHRFKARRDIPFRKKFFVGYDLYGNTYWEFTLDGNMSRLRRKLEPYQSMLFKSDYVQTIPPQWLQWLRRTREEPPTLHELVDDQRRQQRMKILSEQADARWYNEKLRLEQEEKRKLEAELQKVEESKQNFEETKKAEHDPWAEADNAAKSQSDPIEEAKIKPRSK
ncbi:Piso0_000909 [Millerozyma farinosa CBS 7064]|uniref:Piso0_000909 protein n=1 Tax=Pichia sorbitophila (strain ATCC MYA-4447 / BCRC 22081 / CBS 7064 / NBRC 10061 / NRRL Y-12695) TaxID=559304 RepID=G8YQE0_PICSO|nr:Piso0_000909 [Millerozyma farinosa CBS 7064]